MSFVSALVFALSAVKSLASNILRQSKAEIRRRFAESVPITPPSCSLQTICPSQVLETSTLQLSPATRLPQSSPIARLPQELVDAIISYFIYHTRVLLVCSLACHSWYLAAVPHLHHSLTTDELIYCQEDKKYQWSTPLQQSHDLGLLPLVKRLRVRMLPLDKFTPERLCGYNLHYFSALTNLQELGIDDLQVSSFMPNIKQCFGHLAPTLRFLALREPERSPRQILYFIGLFPNLQGLKLYHSLSKKEPGSLTDADLIPLSVPPLRGRLTLSFFTNVRLVKDMMAIFGGLHFRSMDLFRVKCTQLLLEACAETLETLRLYPTDTHVDDGPVSERFDLSRNKRLRTLETTALSIIRSRGAASGFFKAVLSTTVHSLPFDVVITYCDEDLGLSLRKDRLVRVGFMFGPGPVPRKGGDAHSRRFKVFREMHEVRSFRLVLCADVFGCTLMHSVRALEQIVATEMESGGLDYLHCEPSIISEVRAPRSRLNDFSTGEWRNETFSASVL